MADWTNLSMNSGLPLVGQRMLISSLIECPLRKPDLEDPGIISHAPLMLRLLQPGVIRGEFVLHPIPAMLKGICIQRIDPDQVRRFLFNGHNNRGKPFSSDLFEASLVKSHLLAVSIFGHVLGKGLGGGIRCGLEIHKDSSLRLEDIHSDLHGKPVITKLLGPVGGTFPMAFHQERLCFLVGLDCIPHPLNFLCFRPEEDGLFSFLNCLLIGLGVP